MSHGFKDDISAGLTEAWKCKHIRLTVKFFHLRPGNPSVKANPVCDPEIQLENTICVPSGVNRSDILRDMGLDRDEFVARNLTSISAAEQYFL